MTNSVTQLTLLVFVSFSTLVISGMKYIGGGQAGGGGKPKAGRQHHPQGGKQQCYVLSRAQNCHSQPGRTRQSSAAV